jgi:hypothetical protein
MPSAGHGRSRCMALSGVKRTRPQQQIFEEQEDIIMRKTKIIAIPFIELLVIITLCGPVDAAARERQTPAPASGSLQNQLNNDYKPVRMGKDSTGPVVIEAGTLLVIQKGGVLGLPPGNTTAGCTSIYENGDLRIPKGCTQGRSLATKARNWGAGRLSGRAGDAAASVNTDTSTTQYFNVGDKVYVKSVNVEARDTIQFDVVACDACNKTTPATAFIARVSFKFAKGYLESADAAAVEKTLGEVFAPDTSSSVSSSSSPAQDSASAPAAQDQTPNQPQGQGQSPTVPAANPPAQPQSGSNRGGFRIVRTGFNSASEEVNIGDSLDQVQAILGLPHKTYLARCGKKVWVYKDVRITFVNDKVTSLQWRRETPQLLEPFHRGTPRAFTA